MSDSRSPVGQIFFHYKITLQMGSGDRGIVYEAEDSRLGRRVAVSTFSRPYSV